MLIAVERGAAGWVRVRVAQTDDFSTLHLGVAADIPPGDSSRALFESGAAVQQTRTGFLVSTDWLRRKAFESTRDHAGWQAGFQTQLAAATAAGRYVAVLDAIEIEIEQLPAGSWPPAAEGA